MYTSLRESISKSRDKTIAFFFEFTHILAMRLSDHIEQTINQDFMPRSYSRHIKRLLLIYGLAILIVCLLFIYIENIGGVKVVAVISVILYLAIGTFTVMARQKTNDVLMTTEFENMLFAAAASLGSQFCIFIKQDGTIVYANDGAYKTFPRFAYEESRALDALFEEGKVDKVDQERIYTALMNGKKEKLIFPITGANNERHDFILIIEPLKRPAGYFVITGRGYAPERKDTTKMPGNLGTLSAEKLSALIQSIPLAIYVTSKTGTLEFTNEALETALNYPAGSMAMNKMTLNDIIFEADGISKGDFSPSDYEGNVLLSTKSGSLIKATLKQIAIYDEEHTLNGCSAIMEIMSA